MSKRYGEHPPWHDVQLRLQGPVVGALDTTFRERWNDPAPLDHAVADRVARGQVARRGPETRPRFRSSRRIRRPCGPHAVQVLRTYPDAHFEYDVRAARRAQYRARVHQGGRRAKRLIYLEDQYLWSKRVADLFARAWRTTRAASGCRRTAVSRRGRAIGVAAQPRWPSSGDRSVPKRRARAGARLRRREPRGHTGLRARQGLRHRRRLGHASAATISTAARGPTTANCLVRCWTTAGSSPGTCGCGCCVSIWTAPPTAARTTAWSTSTPPSR